ncbi:unnamed protein product, partial [Allacma fusca]
VSFFQPSSFISSILEV